MSFLDHILTTLGGDGPLPERARKEIAQALACADEGELVIAEARLLALSDDFADQPAVFLALGEVRSRRGHDEDAVAAWGRAVDLDKTAVDGWLGLGEALARLGREDPARDALRRVLSATREPPLRARAHRGRAALATRAGRRNEALRELRKAADMAPADVAIAADLGRAMLAVGEPDGWRWLMHAAQAVLEAKAPAGPPEADLLAETAAACPEAQPAIDLLQSALDGPQWSEEAGVRVQAALAERLARAGHVERAAEAAGQALARCPSDPSALAAWRAVCEQRGDFVQALRAAWREAELGQPPAPAKLVRLALGAADREALLRACSALENDIEAPPGSAVRSAPAAQPGQIDLEAPPGSAVRSAPAAQPGQIDLEAPPGSAVRSAPAAQPGQLASHGLSGARALVLALRRFLDGTAHEPDLLVLAPHAPGEAALRFLARALSPGAPPAGGVYALLGFARELAARTPELQPVLPQAVHAAEAVDRPLLVAVMGEFNAGKSTFVNALCGAEIARVGVTPTTATINVLRHGPPGSRIHYHDGRAEELPADEVPRFLARLDAGAAAAVRMVEVFHPLPILRRMEIVDTPGTNSLLPEHERTARDFLVEADAVVWVFSAAQAAKASERGALDLARAADKRVLGVLNKADQVDAAEMPALARHVLAALGERLEALAPLSAREALAAQLSADERRLEASGLPAALASLETRFFQHARALKQSTARAALARFVERAGTLARPAEPVEDLAARHAQLDAAETEFRAALAGERLALPANLDEGFRHAVGELLLLAQPRRWPGDEGDAAGHQEFLLDLLDEVIARASESSKANLLEAARPAPPLPVTALVDQFRAYARGVLAGGVVERFVRESLPRTTSRHESDAAASALARRIPDSEAELFAPLAAQAGATFAAARAELTRAAARQQMKRLLDEERLHVPLRALGQALRA